MLVILPKGFKLYLLQTQYFTTNKKLFYKAESKIHPTCYYSFTSKPILIELALSSILEVLFGGKGGQKANLTPDKGLKSVSAWDDIKLTKLYY